MPIRLNLLAEAKAAEELRRKDPVKRAIIIAVALVAGVLLWAASLKLNSMSLVSANENTAAQIKGVTGDYDKVVQKQKQAAEVTQKLLALHFVTTNRFLNGNLLNALQQTTVEDVQLVRLRLEQEFAIIAGTKARTNNNKVIPATPSKVTERTTLVLDGADGSFNPGDQVARVREAISRFTYFQEHLDQSNPVTWKGSSAPQISPETGRAVVNFTLICKYPERKR